MVSKLTWNIPARSRRCCQGREPLGPETPYYTLLQQSENGQFERYDYCEACWTKKRQAQEVAADATFWRGVVPGRKEQVKDQEELGDRVLELLRDAVSLEDQADEAFVLGLYLARLRKGAARQELLREGQTFTLYEIFDTSEVLCVPRVPLSRLQVDALQQRIASQLKGDVL